MTYLASFKVPPFTKGTIVACPKCGTPIARVENNIFLHSTINSADFTAIDGRTKISSRELILSGCCNAEYIKGFPPKMSVVGDGSLNDAP